MSNPDFDAIWNGLRTTGLAGDDVVFFWLNDDGVRIRTVVSMDDALDAEMIAPCDDCGVVSGMIGDEWFHLAHPDDTDCDVLPHAMGPSPDLDAIISRRQQEDAA